MATGQVDNWLNLDTFGAIYPFVGTEGLLAILGIAFWVVWHVLQIRQESNEFEQDVEKIRSRGGVAGVLDEEVRRETSDLSGG